MSLDPVRWAKFYATIKHGDQKYAGGLPYTHHLAAVEAVLVLFDGRPLGRNPMAMDLYMHEAVWLHDVVEDTGTKVKDIEEMFGPVVAELVQAVTNEKGENRKVRAALTYPKIREAGRYAVRLKLADRIANVETGGKLVDMYRKEHEDFRRALYTAGENDDMWEHLNELLQVRP